MGVWLFLGSVALLALLLVIWVSMSSRRGKRRAPVPPQHGHHREPLYEHRVRGQTVHHSHAGHVTARQDVWQERRQRAARDRWEPSGTLTASRIRSDDEPESGAQDEIAMSAIEYVPTELPKSGERKR